MQRAFIEPTKNFRADIYELPGKSMGPPWGQETPVTPDEPDDSTPVMPCKTLGWMPWRRVRRVCRVGWCFLGGGRGSGRPRLCQIL
jgi:hypothetical protein